MTSTTEKEYYQLTMSINKALNPMESPLKMKHARSVIITTHLNKECKSFWQVVMRQHLMENRFTAWKFCHLLHKVLRDGHPSAFKHSRTHKKMIIEIGNLWGHLQDGVGNCIQAYTKLLVTKLEFHEKNAFFPGTLLIDFRELEKYINNDINLYFQLGVEIFDYLDDIIDVETKVFNAVNTYRMSSMTPQGQCRLAPLIALIQDSNPLYDVCVRLMFKLHDKLPNDLLTGHRERFRELFVKLKKFYDNARPLQYFADLIQVPHLPDNMPNFSSKVDFGTYIPPVVFVQPDPEPVMEQLIDTDNNSSNSMTITSHTTDEITQMELTLKERDEKLHSLQYEVAQTRDKMRIMEDSHRREVTAVRQEVSALNTELHATKEFCNDLQCQNQELNTKLNETPNLLKQTAEEQEKAKASEEKFLKLKTMYTQMRDEHINLLRQHGETTKQLNKEKNEKSELVEEVKKLRQTEEIKNTELSTQNSSLTEELQNAKQLSETFQQKLQNLQTDYDNLEINHKQQIALFMQKTKELEDDANNLLTNKKKSEEHYANQLQSFAQLKNDLEKEKMDKNLLATQLQSTQIQCQQLSEEQLKLQSKCEELHDKCAQREAQLQQIQIESQQQANLLASLRRAVLDAVAQATQENQKGLSCYAQALKNVESLECLLSTLPSIAKQPTMLLEQAVLMGQQLAQLQLQGTIINNTTADIQTGQTIYDEIASMSTPVQNLCAALHHANMQSVETAANNEVKVLQDILHKLQRHLLNLKSNAEAKSDLGDMVQNELADMDKAIAEATQRFVELLSLTRRNDEGIKLEVNGKILDACTALMECIKQLIERARSLQEEIVAIGRGSTSVKEFYKRNSQWTEGLLSAAKSVAKGANLLLDAADKATSVDTPVSSEYFQILVAAQEIAAYTAQLVVASKVKAPKNSERLSALQQASRSVSHATGAVVATVRDCNKYLEQPEPIDITKLTTSQAKTMEMEIHVHVLELEQALQMERQKLASFRRNNYLKTED